MKLFSYFSAVVLGTMGSVSMAQTADAPAVAPAAAAQEAPAVPPSIPITDPALRVYVMYYTASTLEMLSKAIDAGLANNPTILAQANVIILENTPAEIFSLLPLEYQNYLRAALPLEQAAAAQIAALADGDVEGLQKISQTLIDQKKALEASYPTAGPLLNNMEGLTGTIFEELGLDAFQADYYQAHEKELQEDPQASAKMLRAMIPIVLDAISAAK